MHEVFLNTVILIIKTVYCLLWLCGSEKDAKEILALPS